MEKRNHSYTLKIYKKLFKTTLAISPGGGTYDTENSCDSYGRGITRKCDPYVKVKIDGDNVLTTDFKEDTQEYNVGRFVMSKLIQRNSTIIEIEVLDHNGNENYAHERLLGTSGTVDSFIKKPIRCTKPGNALGTFVSANCLEIDVIWQDQRDETQPETSEHENVNHRPRNPTDQTENTKNHRPAHRREQNNDKDRKSTPKNSAQNRNRNRNQNNSARNGVQNASTKSRSNAPGRNRSNRKNRA